MDRHALTDREWGRSGPAAAAEVPQGPPSQGPPPHHRRPALAGPDRRAVARPAGAVRPVADGGDAVLPLDPLGAVGAPPRRAPPHGRRRGRDRLGGAHGRRTSLGVRRTGSGLPHEEMVDYAARRGVTIVAAAGNDGQEKFYYPGAFPSVIAVGSMSPEGGVSEFSTFGPQVSVIAPGENIFSTYLDRGYGSATGTSHASPFVAGVAALIHSLAAARGGWLGDREAKQIIIETADKLDSRFKDRRAG